MSLKFQEVGNNFNYYLKLISVFAYTQVNSRSYDADAALSLWIAQALHAAGALVEGGEPGSQVGGVTAVYRGRRTPAVLQTLP